MNNISLSIKSRRAERGSVLASVLILCTALLIVSAAFFSTIAVSRRINHRAMLGTEAREGSEAALALASAEINRRAVALAAFESSSMISYSLTPADVTFLAGTGTSHLVPSSLGVTVGRFSASVRSGVTLLPNDPAYTRDDSKGITLGVRYGDVYAMAQAKDPITGKLTDSFVAGTIQLRERAWFNYGFFYNMDLEAYPGPRMEIKGAVHTNADLYLGKDGTGDGLYLFRIATAAGHIYRGIKYCLKGYNTDGTLTGFENKGTWNTGAHAGEGTGHVYCTTNGSNAVPTQELDWNGDCLGSTTNPANNLDTWRNEQNSTWKSFLKDSSTGVDQFSPPDLPMYVAEKYETATIELRNHGYAMIEPQLPITANSRYYGRKTDGAEFLKWSGQAGLTIVVSDPDRDVAAVVPNARPLVNMAADGSGIPWKLVWYKGTANAGAPINKENPPARGADGLPIPYELDPFAFNDEVDTLATGGAPGCIVTMQRNLKALLRDCIVVVPYRDAGAIATTFGTGTTSVAITGYPPVGDNCSFRPTDTHNRYNQPASKWPYLNKGDTLNAGVANVTGNVGGDVQAPNHYASLSWRAMSGVTTPTDRYPASSPISLGWPNPTPPPARFYSGLYDRRQGFDGTVGSSYKPSGLAYSESAALNSDLKGAFHVVYIDLQKLNWILNHPDLWRHPTTGAMVYNPASSYTNIVYVDLPSAVRTASRHGAATGVPTTEPDKICPALAPTARSPGVIGKPGYCVMLHKGGRLPRLPYDDSSVTPGFTFATNGPLYIKGNYNADGEIDTGNSLLPDSDASTAATSNTALWYSATNPEAEVPALVAADAVTLLSERFSTTESAQSKPDADALSATVRRRHGYGLNNNNIAVDNNFLEVSTAIVTGLTPTIPDRAANGRNQQSGAINNLPRFLEDHRGQTVRYRGSMAALYDCEVMTARFIQDSHGYWFTPPNRDWGYHQYLAAAKYPPGTPVVRTARLINMRRISAADYADGPKQPSE